MQVDKEVDNGVCLKQNLSQRLQILWKALTAIKHLIGRELQFSEARSTKILKYRSRDRKEKCLFGN